MRYRPDVWPPKRIAQFKKLWADDSLTQEQIAKKIGFDDAGSVGRKARALQLPARTPHWTEAEVARLKRLWEKTRSQTAPFLFLDFGREQLTVAPIAREFV
jgi:hypothetical protein